MSRKAPWPIHKVFRSNNDFSPQRSPSPIVEMPLSPDPETATNGSCMSPRYSVERSLSPRRSQSPFNTAVNKGVREIPIEVEHEVTISKRITSRNFLLEIQLSYIQFKCATLLCYPAESIL